MRVLCTIAVAISLATATVASAGAASGGSAADVVARESAQNKAAASRDAERRLRQIRLPGGARPARGVPSGVRGEQLQEPDGIPAGGRFVTAHAFWTAPGEPREVLTFMRRHPPRGARLEAELGGSGGTGIEFGWRHAPKGIWSASVTITVVKRSGGGSAVRADAWDWWELPRSPASRIPAGAGFLGVEVKPSQEVVEVPEEGQEVTPLPPPRFASTSRASFVAGLVRLVDRKPAYQITTLPSCGPGSFGVTHEFELTFRDHRDGRVLAKLSQHDPIGPCDPLELRVGGRTFRLDFGWDVLRRVQGLIQRAKPRG